MDDKAKERKTSLDKACRDLVQSPSFDGGGGIPGDVSAHRLRVNARTSLATISLALVIGSAGYFALNPDTLSGAIDAFERVENASADGGDAADTSRVDPASEPLDNVSDSQETAASSDTSSSKGTSDGSSTASSSGSGSDAGSGSSDPGSSSSFGVSSSGSSASGSESSDSSSSNSGSGTGSGNSGGSVQGGNGGGGGSTDSGSQKPAQKTVTISIAVDSSAADGSVSGSGSYTFKEGATVYDALCALGLSIGSRDSMYGVYVTSIGGLAEKQYGGSSGWMYAVNGARPNRSCSSYVLKDGDSIQWAYVTG